MMRSEDEIVLAHDMLVGIIVDPVLRATFQRVGRLKEIINYACVLCWILRHDHIETFGEILDHIEVSMKECGYTLSEINKERTH